MKKTPKIHKQTSNVNESYGVSRNINRRTTLVLCDQRRPLRGVVIQRLKPVTHGAGRRVFQAHRTASSEVEKSLPACPHH